MINTNRTVALGEMTLEQREIVAGREAQGWVLDGMDGFNVYMHNEDLMKVVRIDSRGRTYAAK